MTKKVIYKFKGLEIMFSSPLINHVNSNKIKEINKYWSLTPSLYKKNIRQINNISSKKSFIPNISKSSFSELSEEDLSSICFFSSWVWFSSILDVVLEKFEFILL